MTATITFTDNAGHYTWSMTNGTTTTTSPATPPATPLLWTAGTPIALNGFELNLDGVPEVRRCRHRCADHVGLRQQRQRARVLQSETTSASSHPAR